MPPVRNAATSRSRSTAWNAGYGFRPARRRGRLLATRGGAGSLVPRRLDLAGLLGARHRRARRTAAILLTPRQRGRPRPGHPVATGPVPLGTGTGHGAAADDGADRHGRRSRLRSTQTSRPRRLLRPASGGLTAWPAGQTGWTVVLASVPQSAGRSRRPSEGAQKASSAGLTEVGVLNSSRVLEPPLGVLRRLQRDLHSSPSKRPRLGRRRPARTRGLCPLARQRLRCTQHTLLTPRRTRTVGNSGRREIAGQLPAIRAATDRPR